MHDRRVSLLLQHRVHGTLLRTEVHLKNAQFNAFLPLRRGEALVV